jgi:two-component system sensor histidine kinase KdpD
LVAARSDADIAAGLTAAVRATFGVASGLLLPTPAGPLADAGGFVDAQERALAQRAFDSGRSEEASGGANGGLLCLPLQGLSVALGVLALRRPGDALSRPEDRRLLDAFCNQAALALQRSVSERRGASAAVAAETERLRNTLLSGISHDFRTPLTTILGSATSLLEQRDALDAPERVGLLQNIRNEAQRMHAAMSDLLDLTRMEEGAVAVCSEWCPADDLVAEARDTLGARLHGRTVRVNVPPDAIVWCDPRLVQQALVNLIDNALLHTPASSTIDVRIELAAPVWRLIVADDGPGLPAGMEREVFKKFVRANDEPAQTGTGLGLAICAAVARLHGGSIEAVNDAGARFVLTLPQPAAPEALEDPA